MSQREVAIVGKNNTKAAVTGQEELLVRVNSTGGKARTPNIMVISNTLSTIPLITYSIAIANRGTVNIVVNSIAIKPGEAIRFDAGEGNYFPQNTFTINTAALGVGEALVTFITD
jgi:hypothetical protein